MADATQHTFKAKDPEWDRSLRPRSLAEFRGQPDIIERLRISIKAAKMRNEPLGHSLFHGPPGLGKTSLAHIIANEMGGDLIVTSGPAITKAADLAGLLTSLKEGDLLFIDEIHRLSRVIEEYLYPAIEDFSIDLMLDSGPSARSVKITLNRFTLIGATTRVGDLTSALRSRFHSISRLEPYSLEVMQGILQQSSQKLGFSLEDSAAKILAERSRSVPRLGNNLLRWIRDYHQAEGGGIRIETDRIEAALSLLGVDHFGLDHSDRKLLFTLFAVHPTPMGLSTLATLLNETGRTVEEVLEPPLLALGFLERSQRGRQLTLAGLDYLKSHKKTKQTIGYA